jgi:hypothetical protein
MTEQLTADELVQAEAIGEIIKPGLVFLTEQAIKVGQDSGFAERATMAGVMSECLLLAAHMAKEMTEDDFIVACRSAIQGAREHAKRSAN